MTELKFLHPDNILAELTSMIKSMSWHENDVYELIGQAMGHLTITQIQETCIMVDRVKDFELKLPTSFVRIIQIGRRTRSGSQQINFDEPIDPILKEQEIGKNPLAFNRDSQGDEVYERVALSTRTIGIHSNRYEGYQYAIIGKNEKWLRFTFTDSEVMVGFLKNVVDEETGCPLIPDHESFRAAVSYYVKWKMSETMLWDTSIKRDNSVMSLVQYNKAEWLKYVTQAKSSLKILNSIDEQQNYINMTHQLFPDLHKTDTFYRDLGQSEYGKGERRYNRYNYYGTWR